MTPSTPARQTRSTRTALLLSTPPGGETRVVRNGGAPQSVDGEQLLEPMQEAGLSEAGSTNHLDYPAPVANQLPKYWRYLRRLSEADALDAAEVLELLLHFGRSSHQAVSLAVQLLDRFGSLGGVVNADPVRLTEVLGSDGMSVILLKSVRAAVKAIVREPLEDRRVIRSASALMDYLSVTMRHEPTETARILYLDRKNGLIKDEVHRGTVDHTPLYTREVIKRVLELGACAVILVHNHPSGDPTPSGADIQITRQLATALGTIDVRLHDHVIVGRNREISLRKLRLL